GETPFFYSGISFRKLEEFLNFKQLKPSLKEVILIDYYTAGFCWAKEMNFSLMQLSHFMDLLHFLLGNLCDKHMTLEDNIKELGKAMAGIGETESERSGNVGVFSVDQAKAIIDFISIRYCRIYCFLFKILTVQTCGVPDVPSEVVSEECTFRVDSVKFLGRAYEVELAPPAVTPFPAPPEEGTSSDIYASLLASPVAADMEPKESDQENLLGEPSPEAESLEAGAVTSFTGEDQKPTALPNPK
ncbi:UNVERIFIED_CONTAM: hypothetical protein H355_013575, partial [Colinus virginianus]